MQRRQQQWIHGQVSDLSMAENMEFTSYSMVNWPVQVARMLTELFSSDQFWISSDRWLCFVPSVSHHDCHLAALPPVAFKHEHDAFVNTSR